MRVCLSGIENSRRNVMFLPRLHHKRVDSFSLWLFSLARSDEASCHVVAEAHRLRNSCGCECVKIILATKKSELGMHFSQLSLDMTAAMASLWWQPVKDLQSETTSQSMLAHRAGYVWLLLVNKASDFGLVFWGGRGRYILKNLVKASKAIKTARYSSVGVRSSLEKNIAH